MESQDWYIAKAALDWQVEMGLTDAIGDVPVNRYELVAKPTAPQGAQTADAPVGEVTAELAKPETPKVEAPKPVDPAHVAQGMAQSAQDLAGLRAAYEQFDLCDLKKGARNFVFADGVPAARVMIVGEAPTKDEDRQGLPFVGPAGLLLDKMFVAIDLDRAKDVYATTLLPWRPPADRDPTPQEVAMILPFVKRHIELANPDVIICMGEQSCRALLGKAGISRLRGQWMQLDGKPVLPMLHPAQLLRQRALKKQAWADLLDLKHRLMGG